MEFTSEASAPGEAGPIHVTANTLVAARELASRVENAINQLLGIGPASAAASGSACAPARSDGVLHVMEQAARLTQQAIDDANAALDRLEKVLQ